MSGTDVVDWSVEENGVATVAIDRAAKLNALTLEIVRDLEEGLRALDPVKTRALIVRTAGDRVFSVGADLGQVREYDAVSMARAWLTVGHHAFGALASAPFPTVAVIDGLALGGGFELALACDLRVMVDDAEVGLPETGIGAIPGWGGASRITQLVGAARASDLILTRRRLSASEALAWGLTSRICSRADLESTVAELVETLLSGSPVAQQISKTVIAAAASGSPAHLIEPLAGGLAQSSADLAEGTTAFFEKRHPRFTNH